MTFFKLFGGFGDTGYFTLHFLKMSHKNKFGKFTIYAIIFSFLYWLAILLATSVIVLGVHSLLSAEIQFLFTAKQNPKANLFVFIGTPT